MAPAAHWALLHDRPVAVIPVGATFQPGPAADLLATAEAIGYLPAVRTEFSYGARRSVLRFQPDDKADDDRPAWFACGRTDDGYHLVAGRPPWIPAFEETDEHWSAMDTTFDWWALLPDEQRRHGPWTVEDGNPQFDHGIGGLVVSTVLGCRDLTPDVLRTALTGAGLVLREVHRQFERQYTRARAGRAV